MRMEYSGMDGKYWELAKLALLGIFTLSVSVCFAPLRMGSFASGSSKVHSRVQISS